MFILGVGAQKAGTTWLYQQLRGAPGFRSLGGKELHFWDRLIRLDHQNLGDEQAIQSFMSNDSIEAIAHLKYKKYFTAIKRAHRVRQFNPKIQPLVADITPAYAGLPRGVFALIKRELELRKEDYRVIFFMRDPVARIISAFNMRRRKDETLRGEDFAEGILRYGSSWRCQFRTRYEITVANLSEVFPPNRLFFGFNERISDTRQNEDLSDFLSLPVSLFNSAEAVNKGSDRGSYLSPSAEIRDELRLLYRPTYEAIREKFPEVAQLWIQGSPDTSRTT